MYSADGRIPAPTPEQVDSGLDQPTHPITSPAPPTTTHTAPNRLFRPDEIAMPPNVARLPRDERGYPIVFVNELDTDGKPDFRITHGDRWVYAVSHRVCGVCAVPMGYWLMFIGSEVNVDSRLFHDAPMHPECARYAMMACPFLSQAGARRSGRVLPSGEFWTPSVRERPERMALYLTRSYAILADRRAPGGFLLQAAPSKSVEWF